MKVFFITLLLAFPASAAPRPIEAELGGIVDLFYGHEFEKARAAAQALLERHPGHPVGPFFRGVVSFQLWIAEGMASTTTYHSFEADSAAAEAAARRLMKEDAAAGHYYLGATLGFRSRALASRRSYFKALPAAVSSLRHLEQALALDPSLTDARLGLGMYHYFAERIPSGAKPFAYLITGERGNRAKGLEELWSVARSTGAARMEARAILAMILSSDGEGDWAGAEELLAELMTRYPKNPLYRLRRVYVFQRRGDLNGAIALADPDGKWLETIHPPLRASARAWAVYRAAECRVLQGRPAEAEALIAGLEPAPLPKGLADWVRLRRGNLLDALGKREQALTSYRLIESRRPAAQAREFLKTPYPSGPRAPAVFFAGY